MAEASKNNQNNIAQNSSNQNIDQNNDSQNNNQNNNAQDYSTIKLNNSLTDNINVFKNILKDINTIIYREFESKNNSNIKCCIIYCDGMINKQLVNEYVIVPIMEMNLNDSITPDNILDILSRKVITSENVFKISDVNKIVSDVLYGNTLLLVNTATEALIIDTKGWPTRSIQEPTTEKSLRGSKEGFTESIITNLSMIRRRMRTAELKTIFKEIGTRTKTNVCICYVEGIAQPKILDELIRRLDNINIDGILESNYIEEYIRDAPYSFMNTIGNTESPDVACGKLLEGKIIVLCDGTPYALTLPYLFVENFSVYEDYYTNYFFATFNRWIRILALFMGISVPAIYVGIVNFHQELIPTSMFLSISAARRRIPVPTVAEAFAMLIGFSLLREGGLRLPKPIGQTVSIVGALVLGEAAVTARIISAPMVIVTAVTGISSFLLPKLMSLLIVGQFGLLILSSILGLYGYIFGIMGLLLYLMSLRSFGVPYMLYAYVVKAEDLKDTAVRVPWFLMKKRPFMIAKDRNRSSNTGDTSKGG